MSAAPEIDDSLLNGYYTEWWLSGEQPCNVLLEGPAAGNAAVLRLVQRHIREPIVQYGPPATLDLPSSDTHALVVTDAAALSTADQRRLLAWMNGTGVRTQIITMASRPLFPLVTAGLFDAALYYRLNILLLRVSA